MRIALIHYAAPPVVGGVERVLEQQARVLAAHGHEMLILCGNEGATIPGVKVLVFPELTAGARRGANHKSDMSDVIADCHVAIVHNMFTMPFRWDASMSLARLSRTLTNTRFVNWVHDVDVLSEAFAGLRLRAEHVAVSRVRQRGFCEMAGLLLSACRIIPNGVDAEEVLGLSDPVAALARRHRLLQRDIVLFQPARILARKNLELGVAVIAALRRQKKDAVLIITGAADRHRKESSHYAVGIRELIKRLKQREAVVLASEAFPPSTRHVAEFYSLADALFFPSKREGFGLPLIEALLQRVPVFCSDIAIHREILGRAGCFFSLEETPAAIARLIMTRLERDAPSRRRKAVAEKFSWERIYQEDYEPLLLGR